MNNVLKLTILVIIMHLVVCPDTALVSVRVHSVVHVVDIRTLYVPIHVDVVEHLRVGPSKTRRRGGKIGR